MIRCPRVLEAKMLKFPTLLIAALLQHARCSLVMDSISQKGLYLSDYCPKMKYCAEGSHVMCMYYNPHRAMGPRCNRPKNVSITADLADKLLEVSNAVRSKIALGKEKGKGGDLLPKGYGMFRLKWDNELATFAQVLANQCVLRHDMCRATKRFADPGQTAGLVRFTYPEWFPVSKAGHFTKPGLTASKLAYAITQTLKSWYGQKDAVTPGMITSYPDWAENPNNQGGRLYLEMIYGPATHMGCGISAYTEYAYYDNNAALNYNSIQVICNYSSRPRKGGSVYQTSPPTEVGFTVRCGCPIGMDEDPDCLCIESQRNAITVPPAGRSCSEIGHCKPAVVLLPIFTVENAPPEKLVARSGFEMLPFDKKESEPVIADLYGPADNVSVIHPIENIKTNIHSVLSNIISEGYSKNDHPTSMVANSPIMDTQLPVSEKTSVRLEYDRITKEPENVISNLVNEARRNVDFPISTAHNRPIMHDVQKRLFGKHLSPLRYHNSKSIRPTFNHILPRRKSVFSKVATFALPKTEESVIKQDVAPRKDFSDVKNLAQDYLSFKKVLKGNSKRSSSYHPFEHYGETSILKTTTERFLHSAEEKVINFNYYLRNYSQPNKKSEKLFSDNESNFPKDKSNNKLMTLLDTLEQEVKHIELDRNKKEIFDAKIRRIYGTVVGKTAEMSYKTDRESDFTDTEQTDKHYDSESKINKFKHHDEVEELVKNVENIHDKYSDFDNEIRPLSRSQNSLYVNKINSLYRRNVKKAKEGYESDTKYPFSDDENLKSRLDKNRYNDGNTIKSRVSSFNDIDKEGLRTRNVFSDNEIIKTKYPEKRKFRENADLLGVDRRRYYQSKLENLERKLHNTRSFKHHKDNNNRQIRPVLPTAREEQPLRSSKSQLDPFYMPDRARFLHGF